MLVTLSGIVMLVRLVQPKKAAFPMLVTPFPIVMLVRLVQSRKASFPMLVTLSGIVTLVRLLQSWKATSPMLVTNLPSMDAGMISAPDAFLSQRAIVTASPSVTYVKLGVTGSFSPPHPPNRTRGSDTDKRRAGLIIGLEAISRCPNPTTLPEAGEAAIHHGAGSRVRCTG